MRVSGILGGPSRPRAGLSECGTPGGKAPRDTVSGLPVLPGRQRGCAARHVSDLAVLPGRQRGCAARDSQRLGGSTRQAARLRPHSPRTGTASAGGSSIRSASRVSPTSCTRTWRSEGGKQHPERAPRLVGVPMKFCSPPPTTETSASRRQTRDRGQQPGSPDQRRAPGEIPIRLAGPELGSLAESGLRAHLSARPPGIVRRRFTGPREVTLSGHMTLHGQRFGSLPTGPRHAPAAPERSTGRRQDFCNRGSGGQAADGPRHALKTACETCNEQSHRV